MSDKEIDEILEEIKRHSMQENSAESSESEAEEPEQRQDAFSDIIKMINEEDTEEADTQEEPEAADLSFDDEQAKEPEIEPEENDVDFSLPEEEKAKRYTFRLYIWEVEKVREFIKSLRKN